LHTGARAAHALPAKTAEALSLAVGISFLDRLSSGGLGGGCDSAHTPESACVRWPMQAAACSRLPMCRPPRSRGSAGPVLVSARVQDSNSRPRGVAWPCFRLRICHPDSYCACLSLQLVHDCQEQVLILWLLGSQSRGSRLKPRSRSTPRAVHSL